MTIISLLFFTLLLTSYLALRVNRMELRMNAQDKLLRQLAKDQDIDTEMLGKPFGGAESLMDVLRAAWRLLKKCQIEGN